MIIHNCIQGSEEWKALRCGKITMSRARDCIAKGIGKAESKTRSAYLYELASEILTGQSQEFYQSEAMAYGTLTEPAARSAYELKEQVLVDQVGFVERNKYVGFSPDGFVGDKGGLEIKCPNTSTQLKRVLSGEFPSEYQAQVQGGLWVCEREWWDFLSYDGRLKGAPSYFKIRVYRDEEYIRKLEEGIELFIADLKQLLEEPVWKQ